jgi:chromate transporter
MKILNWLLIPSLIFLFWLFFKIGLVFVGGGYVLIPVMQKELVTNLHLLTDKEFIDGVVISQLTPGPVAILVTFAGYCVAGIWGALVSTFALFLPGAALMVFLSNRYEKIHDSHFAKKLPEALTPVIIGLLISTIWLMRKDTLTDKYDIMEIIIAFLLIVRFKINPILILIVYMFAYIFLGLAFNIHLPQEFPL